MSVRWAIPPVIAGGSALLGGLLLRTSGRLLGAAGRPLLLAVGLAVGAAVAVVVAVLVLLELALEDLAGRGARQLVDELDVARDLVAREVGLDVLLDLVL